jgi:hypothetical protein
LVGINTYTLQTKKVDNGDFCVKFHARCKHDGFEWILVSVYGAEQNTHKPEFLVRVCDTESLPILLAGDFNILPKPEEKSNDNFNPRWPFMFKTVIET